MKYRICLSIAVIMCLKCSLQLPSIEAILQPVEIIGYKASNNILIETDSIRAVAMLLNRECPDCCEEEKVYVASCIVTGSRSLGVSWKTYLFKKGQFWGFTDKRITFNPKIHQSNLNASIKAWTNPKKVRFYATSIDGSHFVHVKRNGFTKSGFYQYYSYN